ncbi:uncharacterized protein LOC113566888 [Drosophila persimilis]|uniref:uncharacterized protein LOC113566888 n=1 Tax=Drosophila persimilis TaxID=7234 RepID=UPI000F088136|nr:uncharacterized protein LOC113566888 [Drosophila persimilis]
MGDTQSRRQAYQVEREEQRASRSRSPELQLLASPLVSTAGSMGPTVSPVVSPGYTEAESDLELEEESSARTRGTSTARRGDQRPTDPQVEEPQPTPTETAVKEPQTTPTETAVKEPQATQADIAENNAAAEARRLAEWHRRFALAAATEERRQRRVWEDALTLAKRLKATQEAEKAAQEAEAERHKRDEVRSAVRDGMMWHVQTLHISWASGPSPQQPGQEAREARLWEEAPRASDERDPRRRARPQESTGPAVAPTAEKVPEEAPGGTAEVETEGTTNTPTSLTAEGPAAAPKVEVATDGEADDGARATAEAKKDEHSPEPWERV